MQADAAKLSGDWAKIMDGLNATLGALEAPVTEASAVLERLANREAGEGEQAAGQVAGKLSEIVQGVSKVTDIVAEIASAAAEQASAVAQVTKAVTEMDKVTQQNAASAEESSSAASELSGQAEELAAMVGTFKVESTTSATPRKALQQSPRGSRLANAAAKKNGKNGHALPSKEQFPTGPGKIHDF